MTCVPVSKRHPVRVSPVIKISLATLAGFHGGLEEIPVIPMADHRFSSLRRLVQRQHKINDRVHDAIANRNCKQLEQC